MSPEMHLALVRVLPVCHGGRRAERKRQTILSKQEWEWGWEGGEMGLERLQ